MIEAVRPDKRMAGVMRPLRWEAESPGGAGLVLTTLEGTGGNGSMAPSARQNNPSRAPKTSLRGQRLLEGSSRLQAGTTCTSEPGRPLAQDKG